MSGLNIILAKEFEGELWVKASHHDQVVKQAVEAECEAIASILDKYDHNVVPSLLAKVIRARGNNAA